MESKMNSDIPLRAGRIGSVSPSPLREGYHYGYPKFQVDFLMKGRV